VHHSKARLITTQLGSILYIH